MRHRLFVLTTISVLVPLGAHAQADDAEVTALDYARAESLLGGNTRPLVFGTSVSPNWVDGDRFWYRNRVPGGAEFVLVDPARGTRERIGISKTLVQVRLSA